jgi:DNA invertase Pin-like site-specific DNA recombinase
MTRAPVTRRAALYVRVSTDEQSVAMQERELQEAAKRHGWDVVEVFRDQGISGTYGRDKRLAFARLLRGVARKDFDVVAAWSVDRLGRSLPHLVSFLGELKAKDVDLYLHQQGIDTSTPAGKALFQMLGVFAELERAIIVERVRAGMARAKATGTRSGRAVGRPRIAPKIEARIRRELKSGTGILKTARRFNVGVGTVQRIARELAA